jgi:hypothetical protein
MFGYLDAGSVSVVLAAIAGGIAGIAVFFKMFWHRILGVVSPKHREKAKEAREELASRRDDGAGSAEAGAGQPSAEQSSSSKSS